MFLATIFGFLMDKMAEYRKLEWAVRVFNHSLKHVKQIAALYDPAVTAKQGERRGDANARSANPARGT